MTPHKKNQGGACVGQKSKTMHVDRDTMQSRANEPWTKGSSSRSKTDHTDTCITKWKSYYDFFRRPGNLSHPYFSLVCLSREICCGIYSEPRSILMSDVCNECPGQTGWRSEQPVRVDVLAEATRGALWWCCQHSGIWHVRNAFTPHRTLSRMPRCHFVWGLSPARSTTRRHSAICSTAQNSENKTCLLPL